MMRITRFRAALSLLALGTGVWAPMAGARPSARQSADPAPPPIPTQWPQCQAYVLPTDATLPRYTYAMAANDARLVRVIDLALAHNQDLAAALANIEAARQQTRITGAALLPEFDANGGYTHAGGDGTMVSGATAKGDLTSLTGTMASYEVDVFGRVRGLTAAARAQFVATEYGGRATRLTLIANVANAWLTFASDSSLLQLARNTAAAARTSVRLTTRRVDGGVAPLGDQRKAELTLHQAEADIAAQTTAVAQDQNALLLLVGADVPADALPAGIDDVGTATANVSAGLDSAILLRRPDVAQAEFTLRAAEAQVDVARAAMFPKITLTAVAGVASMALSRMFTGGAFAFGGTAGINYPIFRAGAGRATWRQSQAQRDAALAAYRKAIQSAFADVANVLARRGTIDAQLAASQAARDAAADNYRLSDRLYNGGIGTWLDALTAQQTLYTSEKTLVSIKLARAANLIGVYRAIGGEDATPYPTPVPRGPLPVR